MSEQFVHFNGKSIPETEAKLSVTSRGVAYGDGCFTTLRSYEGKFLHFDRHIERLKSGAEYLGLNYEISELKLKEAVLALLDANNLSEDQARVRIQLSRDGRGGFSNLSSEFNLIITASKAGTNFDPVTLTSVKTKSIPSESLSRTVKLTNSINYIKAASEASEKGFNDALMTTLSGNISETSISNIFWIQGKEIFTPSVKCDLLPGVMRSIVCDLVCANPALKLSEGKYKPEDLNTAEAAFCTNAFREIYPVRLFEETAFDPDHSSIVRLKEALEEYKLKHLI